MKSKLIRLATIATVTMFVACSSNNDSADNAGIDTVAQNALKDEARKVFFSLPSPMELSNILQKSGAKFDKTALHDAKLADKYSTNSSRALNLGVFGADLSYTSVFDQTQETMIYLKAAQKLTDALGISSAFNKSSVERIEKNMNNKDSLMNIISESYLATDAFLTENERQNVSALIIAGGWVEGLYIATKMAQAAPDNAVVKSRIAEQKLSLENLIGLLSSYQNDESVKTILGSLNDLKVIYSEVPSPAAETKVTVDPKTNTTELGANTEKKEISNEIIKKISDKVSEIRTQITN